jgi:hypothetical protein
MIAHRQQLTLVELPPFSVRQVRELLFCCSMKLSLPHAETGLCSMYRSSSVPRTVRRVGGRYNVTFYNTTVAFTSMGRRSLEHCAGATYVVSKRNGTHRTRRAKTPVAHAHDDDQGSAPLDVSSRSMKTTTVSAMCETHRHFAEFRDATLPVTCVAIPSCCQDRPWRSGKPVAIGDRWHTIDDGRAPLQQRLLRWKKTRFSRALCGW